MTDLSGIRIIAYLREDCDLICELLENNFNIDQKHSLDKGALHDDNQFGYQSRHYIVSLDKRRNKLPEFIPFAGLKAEIQVRTALQHAWAALDWRFRYKNAKEAPPEVRRKLYRISANLEGADENFSEVHKAVSELRLHYDGKIRAGDLKIPINSDSLTSFLSENVQFNNIYNKFVGAGFIPSEFDQDSLSRLQGNLETVGIKGLEDLARTIDSSSIKFDVFAGICIEETRKAFPSLNRVMTSKTSALRVSILATLNDEEFELAKFMLTEDAAETIARSRARYQAEV